MKRFGMFLVSALFLVLTSGLRAQETTDYRGVWQAETPQNGKLVLIIKRNNLAAYFWADNADRTVYQGTWNRDAEDVILKWHDGSSHRIAKNLLGYTITHFDSTQLELYATATTKLPEKILGQWAEAPAGPEEAVSDRDRAKGFFGSWQIGTTPNPYYLIIEPDRSAATDWAQDNLGKRGLRGSWAKQGSELHIAWDTGHYGILKQGESSLTFQLIQPGDAIEEAEAEAFVTTRINKDQLTGDWHTLYTDERTTQTGGVAFADRKTASSFYRGPWIVQRSKGSFERIELGRFGGLKTSTDSSLYGNWRISGQDVFMNWDDGIRKILSSVGNGFVLYEYKPGRPIDGVPTRIFTATPENPNKLAEYMKGSKVVAKELIALAEEAGVTSETADIGWGQTFMRWTWPFGEEVSNDESPAALLQTESKSSETADPWWWPLWSETSTPQTTDSRTERNKVSIAMTQNASEVETAEVDRDETAIEGKTFSSDKSDWEWPF